MFLLIEKDHEEFESVAKSTNETEDSFLNHEYSKNLTEDIFPTTKMIAPASSATLKTESEIKKTIFKIPQQKKI